MQVRTKVKRPLAARVGAAAATGMVVALLLSPLGSQGASAATPPFTAVGSAQQVYVLGLPASAQASLLDASGRTVATQTADPLGGLLFRNVPPGTGYRVSSGGAESKPIKVHSNKSRPWDPSVYDQTIADTGYQYLTTRDGTQLAIDVHQPLSLTSSAAPYPTLIEYSGYGYADPSGPDNGIAELANLMGYAVVDVNMRGTGCSGGAFDYFEPLQSLDGYDVIETIAHQSWVKDHKVGMIGISYGAISQLFVAATDPPDLEAISPLSTIDATATTLYPGGILNTGFAVGWAQERQQNAEPAGPDSGQSWAYRQIQNGDTTCAANQALHGEATDLMAKIQANTTYNPAVADQLDPVTFVKKIKVPVFLACQWQDEQTGGHCPDLVRHFAGTKLKWFTFTNGAHVDSLDPATFDRWYDFLSLFVDHQAPSQGDIATIRSVAPTIYQMAMNIPSSDAITLPADSIQTIPTYSAALSAFDQLPEVRVLFDNGGGQSPTGTASAGDPYAGFEADFSSFPIHGTEAKRFYFGPGGTMTTRPPTSSEIDSYTSDAGALPLTDYNGGGLWGNASAWQWNWQQNPTGSAVSYVSAPLKVNTTVIGAGAVYLWVRSSTPDVDLQATISEVRPDGKETFVQNGWIRASERKLSTSTDNAFKQKPTLVQPIPTFLASDVTPMPAGQFVPVAIPLYYEGHAYRAGSRIRVTIAAPNGAQPVWSFGQTEPSGTANVSISMSPAMPSELVLPVVPGVAVPTPLPACPSLRNEPCRPYQAVANTVSAR